MASNYTHRAYGQYSEGAHRAEMEAIGRLRELADEYAGTAVGAEYERQWQETTATLATDGHDYAADEAAAFEQDARPFRG